MGYFRDDTPHNNILKDIRYEQMQFGLSDVELLAVMLSVMTALFDPFEQITDKVRRRDYDEPR